MKTVNSSLSFSICWILSLASDAVAMSSNARVPSPIVKSLAQGMTLLKPVFVAEAKLQASFLGSMVDTESVSKEIAAEVKSKSVVIYTYGLSPFSAEAVAILDGTGVDYKKIEVGAEWFLLDGKDSVKRVLLSGFVENGATSLPKVFVNGQCIGGCAELAECVTTGKFDELVKGPKKKSFLSFL
jgi:glutaredoxin 3